MRDDVQPNAIHTGKALSPAPASLPTDLTRHRKPLHPLTGIRFFAAYYVVFFHTRVPGFFDSHRLPAVGTFIRNGYLAVPLFFVLSGFILAYTYEGQIVNGSDYRRFWEARFARIWPVYALSLLFCAIISASGGEGLPSPAVTLSAFLMVQAWNPFHPEYAGVINLMCWSLSVEALFYLIFPAAQVGIQKFSQRHRLLFLLSMLAVAVLINSSKHTVDFRQTGVFGYIPMPVYHLPEFLAGVAVGNYFLTRLAVQRVPSPQRTTRGLLAGEGFWQLGSGLWTYVSIALTIVLLTQPTPSRWMSLTVCAYVAVLFTLAAETTWVSRLLSSPALLLGGVISYSVYLMQLPAKLWVIALSNHVPLGSAGTRMAVTAAVLPFLAYLSYRLVEDPSRKVIRAGFARWEQRRLTSTRNSNRIQETIAP